MDPVTHTASGLIGASILKRFGLSSRYGWLFVAGAVFPDIDNISGFWGPEAYIRHHRGITHSIFFAVVFSAVVAFLASLLSDKWKFKSTWLCLALSVGLHIFLDVITSYGTQIFLPFSNNRYALDWVFIVDPIFTAGMVALFLFSRRFASFQIVALAFVFFYPCLCGFVKVNAENVVSGLLNKDNSAHVIPEFGSPIFWKVIVEKPSSYSLWRYSVLAQILENGPGTFPRADSLLLDGKSSNASKITQLYQWFSVFPAEISRANPNGEITIADLRFVTTWRPIVQARKTPFMLTLFVDGNGRVIGARLGSK